MYWPILSAALLVAHGSLDPGHQVHNIQNGSVELKVDGAGFSLSTGPNVSTLCQGARLPVIFFEAALSFEGGSVMKNWKFVFSQNTG